MCTARRCRAPAPCIALQYELLLPSTSKEVQDFFGLHGVEDIAGTEVGFEGDSYAIMEVCQPMNSMGVWINRNLDALVPGTMEVTPIQVEARWVCIDFDTDAVVGGGIDYCIHVQGIAFPAQQDTTGGMPNDVAIGVGDGAEHAPGLFLRRESEVAVNRGHNEIQSCQNPIL